MDSILRFALQDLPDHGTPTQWVMNLSAKNQALPQATATALAIAIHQATRSLTAPETTLADVLGKGDL